MLWNKVWLDCLQEVDIGITNISGQRTPVFAPDLSDVEGCCSEKLGYHGETFIRSFYSCVEGYCKEKGWDAANLEPKWLEPKWPRKYVYCVLRYRGWSIERLKVKLLS